MTETWIKSEDDVRTLCLQNYTHVYNFRSNKLGGGVSIFVHNSLNYTITENMQEDNKHYLWIYIKQLSLNLGVVYNPDKTNQERFLAHYATQLESRKRAIVFGDFNIDLLSKRDYYDSYMDAVETTGYYILNKIHSEHCTRETPKTKTIIDHVSTNLFKEKFQLTIVDSPLSDHKQIFVELRKHKIQPIARKTYQAVDFTQLYKNVKESVLLKNITHCDDLLTYIQEEIKLSKIEKTKILNLPQKDWITKRIIDSICRRNELWIQAKENPKDKKLQDNYTKVKSETQKIIKHQKEDYYYTCFENSISDSKKMWRLINTLANNKALTESQILKLKIGNKMIIDENAICEQFNIFFSSIGAELASRITKNTPNKQYYTMTFIDNKPISELTKFQSCTTIEIKKLINSLDVDSSTGIDGITTKAIKCIENLLLPTITDCLNKDLKAGSFPDSLKLAKVSPIYKSGERTDPGNYRPISVLPVMSKIYEKVILKQLNDHLLKINFLYERQYGFREKSSTLSAVLDLVTNINTEIDRGNYCLGIFIDLKKAFDTVSHELLLQKLENIGITGSALELLKSYLLNRNQLVKIGNSCSELLSQTPQFGIPQGSVLGPLLFSIYINNVKDINLTGEITLYADDTCLFYFGDDLQKIIADAQQDLIQYSTWCQSNLLTINAKKTSFMIFSAKNKEIPQHLPLTIDNETLQRSHQEKYLGVILDEKLTWKPHIERVRNKLNSLAGALRRINCIPRKARLLIYNSLVKPHLDYMVEVWGSTPKSNLQRLQTAQNKLVKILFGFDRLTHTPIIYNKTGIYNIKQTYILKVCITIYKILNKIHHTEISLKQKDTSYGLRNAKHIQLNQPRTNYGKRCLLYDGVKIFNDLPNVIKNSESIKIFKNKIKDYLSKKYIE